MAIEEIKSEYPTGSGYLGNPQVKRNGVPTLWTPEKLQEYKKCQSDPVYFIESYVKIISLDDGLIPMKLWDFQKVYINHIKDSRFSVTLAARQSSKSTTNIAFLLWYCLFQQDKTVFILANKGDTARELFSRFTLALENIPYFLQPGTKVLNKGSMEFSNNTKILARATSASSIRGNSANLILLDEYAFVENAEEFMKSTYPVITAGKQTKVIVVSTPNGMGNSFYKIWTGAVQKTNEFVPFSIRWSDVPGRDEKFKETTIKNIGIEAWNQEFECQFLGSSNTLIDGNTLLNLVSTDPEYTMDSGKIRVFKEPIADHEYIMAVDVARGRGKDYSTFNIIDISVQPFEQVAVFQDNMISPLLLPTTVEKYAKIYNNAYVLVEANDNGFVVSSALFYDLEYDNQYTEMKAGKPFIGVEMNKKIKRVGCSNLKDLVEQHRLILHDKYTIDELTTFVENGASYEAESGNHDDLVMNLVLFAWFSTNDYFRALTDISLREELFESRIKEIEDELVPFGYIDDGIGIGNQEVEKMLDRSTKEHFGGALWERTEPSDLNGYHNNF